MDWKLLLLHANEFNLRKATIADTEKVDVDDWSAFLFSVSCLSFKSVVIRKKWEKHFLVRIWIHIVIDTNVYPTCDSKILY